MTAVHSKHTSGAKLHNDNSSAESIKDMLERNSRSMFGWTVVGVAVGVLVFYWAYNGTLVAPNPLASMAWWLVIGVLVAPLIGYVISVIDVALQYRPKERTFREHLAEAGLNFVDYMVVRMVAAVLVAVVMTVVWSVLILAYLPPNLWVGLVGNHTAQIEGLGGLGTWIALILGALFLIGYLQLVRTLVVRPARVVFWVILWTAFVIIGLLPAIGWSIMHGVV